MQLGVGQHPCCFCGTLKWVFDIINNFLKNDHIRGTRQGITNKVTAGPATGAEVTRTPRPPPGIAAGIAGWGLGAPPAPPPPAPESSGALVYLSAFDTRD